MKLLVTTSQGTSDLEEQARLLANELEIPWIPREGQPLSVFWQDYAIDGLLVVEKRRITYHGPQGESFFFHPSMSVLRIKNLRRGEGVPLLEAAELEPGDRVLDGTLGLAADAIVMAWQVGSQGRVVGLEGSRVLHALVSRGLKSGWPQDPELAAAMESIETHWADHRAYLKTLAPGAFDVIYLDPMFRRTHQKSSALQALKPLSDPRPLEPEVIAEAQRVATRWVILKENARSKEFERLGCPEILGSPNAPAVFGRWPGRGKR